MIGLVTYKRLEPFTTRDKRVDVTKAEKDLRHCARVPLADGLARTIEWMRRYYALPERPAAIPGSLAGDSRCSHPACVRQKHAICRPARRSVRPLSSQGIRP